MQEGSGSSAQESHGVRSTVRPLHQGSIGGPVTVSIKDLYAVPDGQTLVTLATGIEIVRRRKHEPIRINSLDRQQLESRTGKKSGSKFLPGTTLEHIVGDTEAILTENDAALNTSGTYTKTFTDDVGLVGGVRVKTLQVLCNGRYAHAFPVAP